MGFSQCLWGLLRVVIFALMHQIAQLRGIFVINCHQFSRQVGFPVAASRRQIVPSDTEPAAASMSSRRTRKLPGNTSAFSLKPPRFDSFPKASLGKPQEFQQPFPSPPTTGPATLFGEVRFFGPESDQWSLLAVSSLSSRVSIPFIRDLLLAQPPLGRR